MDSNTPGTGGPAGPQKVGDQILAAVQRGQEELRRRQEQFRKGQEQFRKGREVATSALRTGRELARSVPVPHVGVPPLSTLSSPAKMREHAREVAEQVAAAQRDFAAKAREAAGPYADKAREAAAPLAQRARQKAAPFTEQFVTSQRGFATRAVEVATPIVAEGIVKLSQVVGALQSARKAAQPQSETAEVTAVVITEPEPADEFVPDPLAATPLDLPAGADPGATATATALQPPADEDEPGTTVQ